MFLILKSAKFVLKHFPLTISISLIVGYLIYRFVFNKKSAMPKILKRDFEENKVYLYEFPRLKNCRNMSPFCIKLEVFLRIYDIPHEIIYTASKRSRNGTLPFIELNGEHIVDSDLIEIRLRKHFNIAEMEKDEETKSVAISKMADYHLFYVLLRYKAEAPEFYKTIMSLVSIPSFFQPTARFLLRQFLGKKIQKKVQTSIGNFTENEHEQILHRDLRTIENCLGDAKFLFGEKMCGADAAVFGQLSSVYHPFDSFVRRVIDDQYPRLKKYMEDVVEHVYPDDFVVVE